MVSFGSSSGHRRHFQADRQRKKGWVSFLSPRRCIRIVMLVTGACGLLLALWGLVSTRGRRTRYVRGDTAAARATWREGAPERDLSNFPDRTASPLSNHLEGPGIAGILDRSSVGLASQAKVQGLDSGRHASTGFEQNSSGRGDTIRASMDPGMLGIAHSRSGGFRVDVGISTEFTRSERNGEISEGVDMLKIIDRGKAARGEGNMSTIAGKLFERRGYDVREDVPNNSLGEGLYSAEVKGLRQTGRQGGTKRAQDDVANKVGKNDEAKEFGVGIERKHVTPRGESSLRISGQEGDSPPWSREGGKKETGAVHSTLDASRETEKDWGWYVVKAGDTMTRIAAGRHVPLCECFRAFLRAWRDCCSVKAKKFLACSAASHSIT